jgi:glycine/D-amino acid oxidase-like deaminating enzyme
MATAVPGLAPYIERLPRPFIDGGYYTKCADNRPLAGPLQVEGAFVHGALSGYGLMASAANSELVAAHITGSALPDFAPAFHPGRFEDPAYIAVIEGWEDATQL